MRRVIFVAKRVDGVFIIFSGRSTANTIKS